MEIQLIRVSKNEETDQELIRKLEKKEAVGTLEEFLHGERAELREL